MATAYTYKGREKKDDLNYKSVWPRDNMNWNRKDKGKIRVCGGGNDKFLVIIIKNKTTLQPRCRKGSILQYIFKIRVEMPFCFSLMWH